MRIHFKHLVATAAALNLAACGKPSTDEALASAQSMMAAGKTAEATIELRNALQSDDSNPKLRLALGKAFLKAGDPMSAIAELQKALELDGPADEITVLLAQGYMASAQYRKLASEFGTRKLAEAGQQAELHTLAAQALSNVGDREAALEQLKIALAADAKYVPARLLEVRSIAMDHHNQQALDALEKVLADNPRSADAWTLKGELLQEMPQGEAAARAAWTKALEVEPTHRGALAFFIKQALAAQPPQVAEARNRLNALEKAWPGHLLTLEMQARVGMAQENFAAARAATEQLQRRAPKDVATMVLSAEVESAAGAWTAAQTLLAKALTLAPQSAPVRSLLAHAQVRGGEPLSALETLAPLLAVKSPAADMLGLAGVAYSNLGRYAEAESAFDRAAKADPKNSRWPAARSIAAASAGRGARSLDQLRSLAANDPSGLADMGLMQALVVKGDLPDALKALSALEKKQAGSPMVPILKGQILARQGDRPAARAAFEESLQRAPQFPAAVRALAGLDLAEGKRKSAVDRYKSLAAARKGDAQTLIELAEIQRAAGEPPAEVLASLEAALKAAPTSPLPAMAIVEHHIRRGRPEAALSIAQSAVTAFPSDIGVQESLAQAQLAAGEWQQAVSTYGKLAAARKQAPPALVALARAHAGAGEMPKATSLLQQALSKAPDLPAALQTQFDFSMTGKQWDQALALAARQQKRQPADPSGWLWEANVHAAQGQWAKAAEAWRQALGKGAGSEVAVKVHTALIHAGKPDAATAHAEQWLSQHPKDPAMLMALGTVSLRDGDYAGAQTRFQTVLNDWPSHVGAMNNLAYSIAMQKRSGGVALAERAIKMDPDRPVLLDTLAVALAAEDQLGKAIELQKKTVDRFPRIPILRLTLARLAVQNGDKSFAREQLDLLERQPSADISAKTLSELRQQAQ
jgi:putative PEP-CTERM system TPR-repeat lipoprotein